MDDRDDNGKFIRGNQVSKGKGRKKGSISINDSIRKVLATKDKKTGRKMLDAVVQQIVTQALKGDREFNPTLIVQLWQQIDGKPTENVNLGGQVDNPLSVVLISPAGKRVEIDDEPE